MKAKEKKHLNDPPKQITAQPIGVGYFVDATNSLRGRGGKDDPMPFLSTGSGSYRKMPTCKD